MNVLKFLFSNLWKGALIALLFASPIFVEALPFVQNEGLPLYYWQQKDFVNFGDYLSVKIVERIIDGPVTIYKKTKIPKKKIIALGSLLYFANTNDVLWGTGHNNKHPAKESYSFTNLDVRAVRGPLTRAFLQENFGIKCPEIYGDPALLFPYLFPEFKKQKEPSHSYVFIPHLYEKNQFPKILGSQIVHPTDPWNEVIERILDSQFVVSGSLHGIIIAEAFGIPARYVRLSEKEPLFKYEDYYISTGRPNFTYATTIQEALELGGEPPIIFDPIPLYEAFPFEYWPHAAIQKPSFHISEE
jgi:pyruvyltransferase